MEKARDCELRTLISELMEGKHLVEQLKNHLDHPSTTSTRETCEFLVEKIISSNERALSMLKWGPVLGDPQIPAMEILEDSPHSFATATATATNSPTSDCSYQNSKNQTHKNVFKKRKTMPSWKEKVHICSGTTGLEGPLGDGYSWRKYGQKDILGATFPRAYYRCTHRNSQSCMAMKQVQRSDQDPSLFEITYRGRHTCTQYSQLSPTSESPRKQTPSSNQDHHEHLLPKGKHQQSQDSLFNIVSNLEVKIEDFKSIGDTFPSFSFPSTPIGSESFEDHIFAENTKENALMSSFSPEFTSETDFFALSPSQLGHSGVGQSDLSEIISTPNSFTNSSFSEFDISIFDQIEFDPNYHFDIDFST